MARELLLDRRPGAAGSAGPARRTRRLPTPTASTTSAPTGQTCAAVALRRDRQRVALRPAAHPRDEGEREPDEEPEAEPAEVAPNRRARAGSGVCGSARRGRRPPRGTGSARRPARAGRPSRGRRACRSRGRAARRASPRGPGRLEPMSVCAAAPELRVARRREQPLEPRLAVELGGLRRVSLRRDRQRGNAAPDERRLLVEAVGEREVEQLARGARSQRCSPGLFGDPRGSRPHERPAGRARAITGELEPGRPWAGDRVQVDHRVDALELGRPRSARRRSRRARRRPSRGRRACAQVPCRGSSTAAGVAKERASTINAAVPDALSTRRGRSRGRRDGPARRSGGPSDPDRRDQVLQLELSVAGHVGGRTAASEWSGCTARAGFGTTAPPARRRRSRRAASGRTVASSSARLDADAASKAGGNGSGSGAGRATLNAARSSGIARMSQVPRYIRAFTGRSSGAGSRPPRGGRNSHGD